MNFIIVDLEATCWEDRRNQPNEIIEIGAVCVDTNMNVLGEFCQFIRPKVNPVLSEFCIQLTSITQDDVNSAEPFPLVIDAFKQWIQNHGKEYILCSWGNYDRVQFKNDCDLHGLDSSWTNSHISLKHQYGKIKGMRRPIGMKGALTREGFELEGVHHRGIDDARNIVKIFIKYFNDWNFGKVSKAE